MKLFSVLIIGVMLSLGFNVHAQSNTSSNEQIVLIPVEVAYPNKSKVLRYLEMQGKKVYNSCDKEGVLKLAKLEVIRSGGNCIKILDEGYDNDSCYYFSGDILSVANINTLKKSNSSLISKNYEYKSNTNIDPERFYYVPKHRFSVLYGQGYLTPKIDDKLPDFIKDYFKDFKHAQLITLSYMHADEPSGNFGFKYDRLTSSGDMKVVYINNNGNDSLGRFSDQLISNSFYLSTEVMIPIEKIRSMIHITFGMGLQHYYIESDHGFQYSIKGIGPIGYMGLSYDIKIYQALNLTIDCSVPRGMIFNITYEDQNGSIETESRIKLGRIDTSIGLSYTFGKSKR